MMKSNKNTKLLVASATGLAVLILDSRTAIAGARSGLELCLHTVLPSLFPFIFLSSIVSASLLSADIRWHRIISRIFRIPEGSEGILLTGLLGGYPIGARCIGEAVAMKRLPEKEAQRMLVFCNAAGPAFLFGFTSNFFQQAWIPWLLWGIHLFSGLCMAGILPAHNRHSMHLKEVDKQSIPERLRRSLLSMGEICGWIILMRTVISIAEKWFLWLLPKPIQILITGVVELSNGCVMLGEIPNTGLRILLCSVFLGFGGLCVILQTESAASSVNQRLYFPGKCFQALISFIIAYIVQSFLFSKDDSIRLPWLFTISIVIAIIGVIYSVRKSKIVVEI